METRKFLRTLLMSFFVILTLTSCENSKGGKEKESNVKMLETFPLVAGYEYNQKYVSSAPKYVSVNFGEYEYSVRYMCFSKDDLINSVISEIGYMEDGYFKNSSVSFKDFFSTISSKYQFRDETSEEWELLQSLIRTRTNYLQAKQKFKSGYRGSSEEERDIFLLEHYIGTSLFTSFDKKVIVECFIPEIVEEGRIDDWTVSGAKYKSRKDWIDEINQDIKLSNESTNLTINNHEDF